MTDDNLLKVGDYCLIEGEDEYEVQWIECRDFTPDTHWALSIDEHGPISAHQKCLANERELTLIPCDGSTNQTWLFERQLLTIA